MARFRLRTPIRRLTPEERFLEARRQASPPPGLTKPNRPARVPDRLGYAYGVPRGGLDENNAAIGASTQTDRSSLLQELWEAYLTCPWAWACVNAVARTITAGGLVTDWDADTGEGKKAPAKPPEVEALERLIDFCNPTQDIRQLLRNVVCDLMVFGDAFIEVVWMGGIPVALYNLDCPTTTPVTDEHGNVSRYVQVTQYGQRAEFDVKQVIHISLDSARPSVFGVSPTHAALEPIKTWLFAAGLGKNMFKKGLPPTVHMDFPAGTPANDVQQWGEEYVATNLGPKNVGNPLLSRGGATAKELQAGKFDSVKSGKDQARDEILSSYGVPPSKVGVIESGNLGGGTGTSQDKTYRLDTCDPIAGLIVEKLQFHIAVQGFGVRDWHLKFGDVDYRDDKTVEEIKDMRLRNGAWTLNKYRASIGEPPVPGGDDAVLVDRQNLVLWKDMAKMSRAMIASKNGKAGGGQAPGALPGLPPVPPASGGESASRYVAAQLGAYRKHLAHLRKAGVVTEHRPPSQDKLRKQVYDQLADDFPPEAIEWVKQARWSGPMWVDASRIDTTHEATWAASHDTKQVKKLLKKQRKRLADGKHPKPAILVRTPGADKDIIADGHHHAVAAMQDGPVWAYVAHVDAHTGDWDTMHASQDHSLARAGH